MSRIKVAVITGPTGTGKTKLAIELARTLGGEVVSADSMQLYREMDIGTAKPDAEELSLARHHMIDIASPEEDFSVALYAEMAAKCVEDIASRGKLPIIAGGTGLYIDSLLAGHSFAVHADAALRASLEREYDELGGEAMLQKLAQCDPFRAGILHANDKKRIVRALEVFETTGKPISQFDEETKAIPPRFESAKIALNYADREKLYARIDARVDEMFAKGLVREVEVLLSRGICPEKHTAMQAIGYKEIVSALRGEISEAEARELIKRESRRYAKRQLTWLRRDKSVMWIEWGETPDFERARLISTEFLAKTGIITA